jgi:hypothetical protein
MAVLFDQVVSRTGQVGAELWLDLGLIPLGRKVWVGSVAYTSVNKAITFEVRSNLVGKSTSGTTNTVLLATGAPKVGATLTQDLYRNGRLYTVTVTGTGTERWWLCLKSKTKTLGDFMFKAFHTLA